MELIVVVAPVLKNTGDKPAVSELVLSESLPKSITKKLIATLTATHGIEAVNIQLRNLASKPKGVVKDPPAWLRVAVNEGYESKVESNLFAVQKNKELETKLVEKLESASRAPHEFVNQDFMQALIAKHGCVSDMIAGASANG